MYVYLPIYNGHAAKALICVLRPIESLSIVTCPVFIVIQLATDQNFL